MPGAGMSGMTPGGGGMMNRPVLPPQQHQPQYPPMQHAQPPQYPMGMQQPPGHGGMMVNTRPVMGGVPVQQHMMMSQPSYQQQHHALPQPGPGYGLQPPQVDYSRMPPGYVRGGIGQPGMVVPRSQLHVRPHILGGGVPGRVTPLGMGGGGMVQPASAVPQTAGVPMMGGAGGGGMVAPHPAMVNNQLGFSEQGNSGVQSVTAVPNPSFPLPGGGTRPPSVPPYSSSVQVRWKCSRVFESFFPQL